MIKVTLLVCFLVAAIHASDISVQSEPENRFFLGKSIDLLDELCYNRRFKVFVAMM